jgi:hypothetical protein
VVLDLPRRPPVPHNSWPPFPSLSPPSQEPVSREIDQDDIPRVPPRREYVWQTIDRGQQSLAAVANRINLDLDIELSSVWKLALTDWRSAHRCAGYVREEIILATTRVDSVVVSHDAPSPQEVCSICHEVVGSHEVFQCICGDPSKNDLVHLV